LKHICILGSTGSIGTSTLSIIERYPERFAVASLAAGANVDLAFSQCQRWRPIMISMATEPLAGELAGRLKAAGLTATEVVYDTAGTVRVATLSQVDFVVSAIVGLAGLEATYAAVAARKPVGLANKEAMVAAGEILTRLARRGNVPLLPIDSEHNAIHQCMRGGTAQEVRRIWLTASGGPFRQLPADQFQYITVDQALRHPTWIMGKRVTIDSATLLNKGLEIIEACRLFDLPPSAVRVTVHPQSAVHSLVEFVDGSILAQISVTDMRLPILYAMSFPERVGSEAGGAACIALNAADEIAVGAFLEGSIAFTSIPRTIEAVLEVMPPRHPETIQEVLQLDEEARRMARSVVAGFSPVLR
jgi:1-deoxy-D-xylulose-5-phosphate reductoisomerase